MKIDPSFGCEKCNATPAPNTRTGLKFLRYLFEGMHEEYALSYCQECNQHYVAQLLEIQDFEHGNDELWSNWVPITPNELRQIELSFPTQTTNLSDLPALRSLMHLRRRLSQGPTGVFAWCDFPYCAADILFP